MPVKSVYHVVTYVDRTGDGHFEPVAAGKLERPAGAQEGAATEAVLGHIDGFQCDGQGDGTDGCDRLHNHAAERIVARARPDGQAQVTWRRYHPKVATGLAAPGRPFEAEDPRTGTRVRVEIREIDPDAAPDLVDDKVVAEQALPELEAKIEAEQRAFAPERELDQRLRQGEHELVDYAAGALADAMAALEKTFGAAGLEPLRAKTSQQIDAAVGALREAFVAHAAEDPPPAPAALDDDLARAREKVDQALSPLRDLGEATSDLPARLNALTELVAAVDAERAEVNLPKDAAWTKLTQACEAIAAEQLPAEPKAAQKHLEKLAGMIEKVTAHRAEAQAVVEQRRAEKAAFEARVARVTGFSSKQSAEPWERRIREGQGLPGFNVKHWLGKFDAVYAEAAASVADPGALDFGDAEAAKRLGALEKKLSAVLSPFHKALEAELTKRSQGVFRSVDVGGQSLNLPHAAIRALEVNGDFAKLEITARHRDERPIELEVCSADGATFVTTLRKNNELAVGALEGRGPFELWITKVGDRPYVEGDQTVPAKEVEVVAEPLEAYLAGAHLYAAQHGFRVAQGLGDPTELDCDVGDRDAPLPGLL